MYVAVLTRKSTNMPEEEPVFLLVKRSGC